MATDVTVELAEMLFVHLCGFVSENTWSMCKLTILKQVTKHVFSAFSFCEHIFMLIIKYNPAENS